jgi:hypothetical protein
LAIGCGTRPCATNACSVSVTLSGRDLRGAGLLTIDCGSLHDWQVPLHQLFFAVCTGGVACRGARKLASEAAA